jgi:hypothetical protein
LEKVRAERDESRRKYDAVANERDQLRAFLSLGETYERDLRQGRLVAVVGDKRIVFMERSALRRSLQRHVFVWTVEEFANSFDYRELHRLEDAEGLKKLIVDLEADALRQSEAYRQRLAADITAQLARYARLWDRQESLRLKIRQLEDRASELERADFSRGVVTPDPSRPWPAVDKYGLRLSELKQVLGVELDQIRKAGNWSADHHFQVGTLIGSAKSFDELRVTERLMRDYADCYGRKNLRRAVVLANARTGMYKTPGERIAALDEIAVDFNTCAGKAAAEFQTARGRLSSPAK